MFSNSLLNSMCAALAVVGVSACGGSGGGGDALNDAPDPRAAYLNVSVDSFYFGTRDVGTSTTQTIELANWSGDKYPINRLIINGENSEEFASSYAGGITLEPSQKILVDVTFTPITNGIKAASLDVDYDIIEQVSPEANAHEQIYYRAKTLEDGLKYEDSREQYQAYVEGEPATDNKRRAAIKLPVLDEAAKHGAGDDFDMYVAAINYREEGSQAQAIHLLDRLTSENPNSVMADDALYLQGYIQLMDQEDYAAARDTMFRFRQKHSDSTYYDTALYSEAIALEELGEANAAASRLNELVDRHKSDTWAAINLNIAKDNYLSRLWFDRANQALDRING